jgi:Acyl-CoA dehydrogenase, N-terminal domain
MEFRLDSAQVELQQTVARFCADRFPLDAVVEREGAATDRASWDEMAALGMFGLLLPEDAGGSGLGVVEGALLFEQLGSHLAPGPVLWTVLAAPLVDGAAAGRTLVGGVEASAVEDGAAVVEHAGDIDVVLVVDDPEVAAVVITDTPVETVAAALRERLSAFKVPTRWLLTPDPAVVPMSATGKVDKPGLQRLLREQGGPAHVKERTE